VLTNLISNAIKFRGPQPPEVELSCVRSDAFWQICCTDNGIGIDPQYADKIFLIFQRLHPRDVYTGTGIGLALCKRIVEYHGGRIWLDADYAAGTRICFTLPAERTPQ
jgi:light-regulated signal transduction histidine kinase (bacteriophytochrome)